MDKMDLPALEKLLGISQPWTIKSITADTFNQTLDVYLEQSSKKKRFGFKDTPKDVGAQAGSWTYMPVGSFRCVIHASVPSSTAANERSPINTTIVQQPAFIGHPNRNYSNFIRQKVAVAHLKSIPVSVTLEALQINETLYKSIVEDLNTSSVDVKQLTYLPTETDPVWRNVLQNRLRIKTDQIAFRMLLSKLQLATGKEETGENLRENAKDLWRFFYSNAHQLEAEIDQVCGITTAQMKAQAAAARTKQKLILPAIQNPVWIEILTGKVELGSRSIPLNLLISKQRIAFMQGETNADKVRSIETLREYVKQNYRNLKNELILINKAMKNNKRGQFSLPEDDHEIWQRILEDDGFVPSHNMAYKLLLSKLRMQVKANRDPVVRIEAARNIRSFMRQNRSALQDELKIIAQHSPAR